jgi:hypothetical protein
MPKRTLLAIVVSIAIGLSGLLTAATVGNVSAAKSPGGSRSGVSGGVLFGGNAQVAHDEAQLGRKLAIVREYFRIGNRFPWPADRAIMAKGSTILASLDAGRYDYASIAAGHEDAKIISFLRELNHSAIAYHLGAIYISFEHEASAAPHRKLGSTKEFVKAWDRVHGLAESAHLNWNQGGRLHWVLILSWRTYLPRKDRTKWQLKAGFASQYFAGRNEVDIVAADGYDTRRCTPPAQSANPRYLFDPLVSFAHSHGLPVFISEWGANAKDTVQPDFVHSMKAFITHHPAVAAALYWSGRGRSSCNFTIQGRGLTALAAMGHSPGLSGHIAR